MSILKNKITTKKISAENGSQDEISYRKKKKTIYTNTENE